MQETFNYSVVIHGLDGIPLRTTVHGAKNLMRSFHKEHNMEKLLLEAVDAGIPYKNKLVSVSALFPKNKVSKKVVSKTLTTLATKKKASKKVVSKTLATKKRATRK